MVREGVERVEEGDGQRRVGDSARRCKGRGAEGGGDAEPHRSLRSTRKPLEAETSAMPAPMSPAPKTAMVPTCAERERGEEI